MSSLKNCSSYYEEQIKLLNDYIEQAQQWQKNIHQIFQDYYAIYTIQYQMPNLNFQNVNQEQLNKLWTTPLIVCQANSFIQSFREVIQQSFSNQLIKEKSH
ncbi:hypothetical protein [Chroococcus sp. FPU101]|uniref:hypothetical protein n=1 Tax=Chroococcus sp. FPU101 TaxID=1974212 RepID=UPI001A8D53AA|nr:hypothetical protein [Chroococcus sp. FPU101]GFE69025.1 hypothetical protein CFPU101_16350 [Chroococcus sp. FPU101]